MGDAVSEIQRDYLVQLAAKGRRFDGRGLDEYRPISIQTGLVKQAEGSCRVRLGRTDVVCGIKLGQGTPYGDAPDQGVLQTNAELIPMASPDFEVGPPSPESIELARVVDRGIRESKTLNMGKLCITPGEKVWMAFIDIHVVDYDGNLFDAASLAALGALMTGHVPWSKVEGKGDDQPLPVEHQPVMCTSVKIGDGLFMDPSRLEEKVGGPRLSVSVDENGDLRAMQKGLSGGLAKSEVGTIINRSRIKAAELRSLLLAHVKESQGR